MEPLHRVEFAWRDGTRLEIEVRGAGEVECEPIAVQMPGLVVTTRLAEADHPRAPALSFIPEPDGFFEPLQLRENTEYVLRIVLPVPKSVALADRASDPSGGWPFDSERAAGAIKLFGPRDWRDESDGSSTMLIGTANFGSSVGVVDLSFRAHPVRAEVASSKIGYFDEFRSLLDEVSENLTELLFEVDSVSGYRFALSEPSDVAPSTALFHLRRLMDEEELPAAVESIIHHPHTRLVEHDRTTPTALARSVLPDRLAAMADRLPYLAGGPLAGLFHEHTPTALIETLRQDTVDTPENRYAKSVLEDLLSLLDQLEHMLRSAKKFASLREVERWQTRLSELLADHMWRDVGPLAQPPFNSQVLLRRDKYRRIAQADLLIQYGLVLPWDRAHEIAEELGDIRPIYELYEYACLFALRRVLRSMCGPENQELGSFYARRGDQLNVELRTGKASRLSFSTRIDNVDISVSLFFNRRFRKPGDTKHYQDGSYSAGFRPDLSILAATEASRHWVHFDAKYRLDLGAWENQMASEGIEDIEARLDGEPEDRDLFKKADLYKMHTYRDAILGSRGAYVLFPAATVTPSLFVRHRDPEYRAANAIPSVGAFPLRPGGPPEQEENIRRFLFAVFEALAATGGSYSEEAGLPVP